MKVTKLVEVVQTSVYNKKYSLREVFVNPDYVISLMPDSNMKTVLQEGRLPDGLDKRQEFTRVTVHKGNSGLEMVVVGNTENVRNKLFSSPSTLLKG